MGLKQTYKTIMSVNSAVLCNNLIYFLRRIPLIKNIISETLYAAYGTKDAIKVFAVILNFFKSVFGTVIYLGIFFYVPLLSAKSNNINISDKDVLLCCLTIFFFMNYLAGGVFMHELKPNANDRIKPEKLLHFPDHSRIYIKGVDYVCSYANRCENNWTRAC